MVQSAGGPREARGKEDGQGESLTHSIFYVMRHGPVSHQSSL